MRQPRNYEVDLHASFDATLREADAYFAKKGRVHRSLHRLASCLETEKIAYALVGSLALGEHGYVRMTEDIDVLLTPAGLARFHERLVGRGYLAAYPGASRSFRDAKSGVRIEVLVSGEYPGDGKPKPVSFPDPAAAAEETSGIRVLALPKVIELKLASGMSAPHRLRDLADVQELMKVCQLGEEFAAQLDPSVRATYLDLLRAVRAAGSGPPVV